MRGDRLTSRQRRACGQRAGHNRGLPSLKTTNPDEHASTHGDRSGGKRDAFAIASDALADDAPRAAICKTAEETGYGRHPQLPRLKYEAADKRLNAVYKTKMASLDARAGETAQRRAPLAQARDAKCAESRQPDAGGTLGVEVDSCFVNETERRIKVIDAFR